MVGDICVCVCVKGRFKGQFYTLLETQVSNH